MKSVINIQQWGFYLCNIPYWDKGGQNFAHKARPILVYNFSGGDVIVLPVTSNENEDKTKKREANAGEVDLKLRTFSLIKVNKPITIDKLVFIKDFKVKASTKTRRQVKGIFKEKVLLKEK